MRVKLGPLMFTSCLMYMGPLMYRTPMLGPLMYSYAGTPHVHLMPHVHLPYARSLACNKPELVHLPYARSLASCSPLVHLCLMYIVHLCLMFTSCLMYTSADPSCSPHASCTPMPVCHVFACGIRRGVSFGLGFRVCIDHACGVRRGVACSPCNACLAR